MFTLERHLYSDELFLSYPKPLQTNKLISSVIEFFYSDVDSEIIIDKNRAWPEKINYIEGYLGCEAKIICPVRDVEEILTSFISMIRRNPYKEGNPRINFIDECLIKSGFPINDFNRCNFLVGPQGILGQSLAAIRSCILNGYKNKLHMVEYKDLVSRPEETLKGVYNFLDEEPFAHSFEDIRNNHKERDLETYGLGDMHQVRPQLSVSSQNPASVLSPNILAACAGMNSWRDL